VLGLIGKTLSHYTILEQIGQGGMSSVFSAVDVRDGRAVAVKVLSPYIASEPRFRARFEREIKLLGRLQHPNIMPILDFGEAEGLAFIVMPFVGTGTLADRLHKGPLAPKDGARIVEQLASALAAAHAAGVVHRDVKPSNVLLDPMGNALLSDFSFAHQTDASQNLTGSALIGTPAYMSPEQCRGDPIDPRSDQYALAVVLYQITTGKLPFEGDTPMATALKHVNEPLPRPRLINPSIPDEIELVLVKGLAKDPALRYGSVLELNDAFQQALGAALDPTRQTKTRDVDRTTAIYNKYQNVQPPPRRRRFERVGLVAGLLLLLACPAGAAAAALFYPGLLVGGPRPVAALDIQGTVDVLLTLNAPLAGTAVAPEDMKTAVYLAVIQTLAANGTPITEFGVEPIVFGAGGGEAGTALPVNLFIPTSPATSQRTPGPTTPTATPSPSRTLAPGASPSAGPTLTSEGGPVLILLTDVGTSSPTAASTPTPQPATATVSALPTETPHPATPTSAPTSGATNTPPPPATNTPLPPATNTPAPPAATNTPVPPAATNTPRPPTNTPEWKSACGPDIPPGQCKKTLTAAAGG